MNQGIRLIIAVLLMIGVVILTNILFPPVPRGADVAADSVTTSTAATTTQQPPAAAPAAEQQAAAPQTETEQQQPAASTTTSDTIVVESSLYRFAFDTRGAALVSAEMLGFNSYTRDGPVQLAGRTPGGLLRHNLRVGNQVVELSQLLFTPSAGGLVLHEDGEAQELSFTHQSAQYGTIQITYKFTPDDYQIHVGVQASGGAEWETLHLRFGPTLAYNEAKVQEDQRSLAFVVNSQNDGIEGTALRSVDRRRVAEGPLDWVALKNKYFVFAAVVDTAAGAPPFGGLIADDVPGARYAADLTAMLPRAQNGAFAYRLYVGPQEYDRLVAVGNKLQDVNPVGWRVFRPIIRPLAEVITWALITMHRVLGISYGWVLIIFGVMIRLAMWPLNAKAMRSQLKSMELQPRLKDIQTRFKNEPEKLQKEMLKLYKEEGFNPMGGCLPMLIPMPVLITLFFVFQNSIEFRGVPFLWLPDLSRADPYYILPIILGGTIFVQQLISMKTMPPNPQMKFMMYFMPAFMLIIFLNLASGLNLYYAAQNLPGFIQQLQLNKERAKFQKERGLVPSAGAGTSAMGPPKRTSPPQSSSPGGKKSRKR